MSDTAVLLVAATQGELCEHPGLVCGVGPVEAAAATARALELSNPAVVLHVGVAGGRDLPLGSVVIGNEAIYCDLRAAIPVVDRVIVDSATLGRARSAVPDARVGPIGTSAAVGSVGESASVEAMEGFGVLRAAERAGVPAIEVRVVSNEIGESDRGRWRVDDALAILADAIPALMAALRVL